ncbi:fatty acid desaturase [Terrarubrum flagellatum]|uniref:fatty acid desaturase n=1 Tax=Terrirubrum flagellatum TaxID=2895980 RepID=UPI003144E5A4
MDSLGDYRRNAPVEWPTLALFAAIYLSFAALTFFHAAIPLWLWLPLAAWTSAWWGSAQHEALHGHPTRIRAINTALATAPFWLWMPFERYRDTHLTHHRDERLTDPLDDPESRYWTPNGWRELGPFGQKLVDWQATLAGRLIIGPVWSMWRFCVDELHRIMAGDRKVARIWAHHLIWVALLMAWVIGVCRMPLWLYLLGFVYLGTSLALVRSFAEHRAHDEVEKRTAIVENSAIFGLLFLHNNLHVVHHRWPTVPWYRLPQVYRAHRDEVLALNGGLVYAGYRDVFRRFLFRAHDAPLHPRGRAPLREETPAPHAGNV